MKKSLLFLAVMAACAISGRAENQVFAYTDAAGNPIYGILSRVSANGRWAVGTDQGFQTGSYIIDTTNPSEYQVVKGGEFYDVANTGMVVGSWYENIGTVDEPSNNCLAAYYQDGKWTLLPEPLELIGESHARCVSDDGKVIGGMIFCSARDSEAGGKYYPCIWTLTSTGDYELSLYNDLDLPGNMGFVVNDMTPDGRTLVGYVYAHAGSTVPAIVTDGVLKVWNRMEMRSWPYYYKDQTFYYDAAFIDDIEEGAEEEYWFNGGFYYVSGDYAFGHRSVASDVDPERARGTVTHMRTIYNLATDTFTDEPSDFIFASGIDPDHAFLTTNMTAYYKTTSLLTVNRAFGLPDAVRIGNVYGFDDACQVLACSTVWLNDAIGDYVEAPVLVILDEPLAAVAAVAVDSLATDGAVYDLQGRRVADAFDSAVLAPGVYVSGGRKVLVK